MKVLFFHRLNTGIYHDGPVHTRTGRRGYLNGVSLISFLGGEDGVKIES